MSKELFEKRNKLTYDLRQALDKWEADNKKPTSEFDIRANGLLRDNVARLEAELDQVESELTRSHAAEKLARKEAELAKPEFDTRNKSLASNNAESELTKRYAQALFSGDRYAFARAQDEVRTYLTTTGANFSSAVPTEWQSRIVEKLNRFNIMRSICPVRNVSADQKIVVGGVLPTSYKVSEGTNITEDSTYTIGNVDVLDLTYACYVPITKQYQTDAIGGMDYVARKSAESLSNLLEDEYTNGAGGAGNMPGILSYAGSFAGTVDSGVAALGSWSGTTASDQLIDLAHTVAPQYRRNASYMMSDTVAKTVRKLKGGDNQYIWKTPDRYSDIREGMPSTIYGFPVYINQTMETAPAAAETFVLFGDFNYYECYDRNGGVDIMIDPYSLSQALTTKIIVSHRTYGVCTNPVAFANLTL